MKNRTAIGIVCIILAVAVTFVVSPLVNNISDKKTEVVRFVGDVSHGTEIKDTDVEIVKISNSALPEKVIKDKKSVVGKFATADIFKGDFATESKITDNANTANDIMASLKGDTSSIYPINRVEKIGFVREHLAPETKEYTTEKVAEYPAVENGKLVKISGQKEE
ncbi:MAG: SAF domain-containing protein [Oscillospiraceae bacterium]|nr:SAF domain-containing protein [Oscillospiraceae bacterium]